MTYILRLVAIVAFELGLGVALWVVLMSPPLRFAPTYALQHALGIPHIAAGLVLCLLVFAGVYGGIAVLIALRPRD